MMAQAPVGEPYWAAADIPALVAALVHKNAAVRRRAREDLIAVGRPAVDVLFELLHDRRPHVRWEAAKVLLGIGDPRAAPCWCRRWRRTTSSTSAGWRAKG